MHVHLQVQAGTLPPVFEANQVPSAIFALDRPGGSTAGRPVVAYHGTAMENLHSILNTGAPSVRLRLALSLRTRGECMPGGCRLAA